MAAILKWMFVLVLLIAVAGGGTAYWLYCRSDEGLRQLVLTQLATMAPTVKFDIERARWDGLNSVRISGLTVALPDEEGDRLSLEVQEVVATLDPDRLLEENVVIQKLQIIKPKLLLIRHSDGVWNWQKAGFSVAAGGVLPDVEIEHATIVAEFHMPERPARKLRLQEFNLSARPADSKRLSIRIGTLVESDRNAQVNAATFGPLTLQMEAALDGSTWKCASRDAWRVTLDSALLQLAADLSPDFAAQIANAGQWMANVKAIQKGNGTTAMPLGARGIDGRSRAGSLNDGQARGLPSIPVHLESHLPANPSSLVPDFGVRCVCDFDFRVQKNETDGPPKFEVSAAIASGEIDNDMLPAPLKGLKGKVYADNRRIIVRNVQASSGQATIILNGDIIPNKPIAAGVTLRGVELNEALKARLPEKLRNVVQAHGLTGICDVVASFTQDQGQWRPKVDLILTQGTITDKRFPLTVRDVAGELHLENNTVRFDATGKYAGQVVTANGTIANPGPAQQVDIFVKANNLPLDDESLAACPPPVFKAIDSLKLRCRHDLLLRIKRSAGIGEKYEPELREHFYNGTLNFNGFQYVVQQLEGFLIWKSGVVEFKDLKGVHDGATISASGIYQQHPGRGRLDLTIDAKNAAFDRSLKQALSPDLRQVWNQFQPLGIFDVSTKIAWVPETPCEVRLPRIIVRDGQVTMKCFSWTLQKLNGEFSYNTNPETEPGTLVMHKISAQHDDTLLNAEGSGVFSKRSPWTLTFTKLNVDNLVPNTTFRNSLPDGLQRTIDFLRPEGVFSFRGPVAFSQLRQGSNEIRAEWNLTTVLFDCAMNAGTRLDQVNGVVQIKGAWDGTKAKFDGDLDLDTVEFFRKPGQSYQVTKVHGPISFDGSNFTAGTVEAIPPRKSDYPDEEQRIRGEMIGGTIYLDAFVDLSQLSYRAFIELKNGKLERYAQKYLGGRSKLAGIMNGWTNLHGKGGSADRLTGDGKLIIAPAALYELPLFAQLFQLLQLQSADKTAFEQAELNFTIANERFDLNSIEFLGDALKMRGRGYVRFDGGMQLDFGLTRRQLIPIPFKGLIVVKVTGNVGDPKTKLEPYIDLDDGMKQFLGSFDPRKMSMPRPMMGTPRTGQNSEDSPR